MDLRLLKHYKLKIKKYIKFLWYEKLVLISLNIKKIKNNLFLINSSLSDDDKKRVEERQKQIDRLKVENHKIYKD